MEWAIYIFSALIEVTGYALPEAVEYARAVKMQALPDELVGAAYGVGGIGGSVAAYKGTTALYRKMQNGNGGGKKLSELENRITILETEKGGLVELGLKSDEFLTKQLNDLEAELDARIKSIKASLTEMRTEFIPFIQAVTRTETKIDILLAQQGIAPKATLRDNAG